ncbi:hypothetical protein G7Y89_g8945 [Cudoniella acicularis]|uniref:DUF1996 domain-containing protein n=1 Tax=Cudoniella acicularis TaxID=354080 RepID=A0A8H4W042_9HELO|nr:hypothetical protein G7Y89_g8945 [Cudoniella acicularis]
MYSPAALTLLSVLSSAASVQAILAWTVNCGVLSVQRSDPIVSPGVASGHVHAISGGTAFQRTMTGPDVSIDSKQTTCDKFTDHSNYWAPQLYHMKNGMFEIVPYTGVNSYYKNYTCSYNPDQSVQYCPSPTDARAFPPGLRMIAGDPTRRTQNDSIQSNQAILWETGDNGEHTGFPTTPLADRLQLNVRFPSCWDGVNLDSPDHSSHVAYPDPNRGNGNTQGGMCPESHPVALISIGSEFGFATGTLGLTDSSNLVLSMGDTTGYGGHADFLQGWTNQTALTESFANCNGIGAACAWNSFGTPDGSQGTKNNLSPEVPAPVEDVGLNGPISKLPGNNPVWTSGMTYPVASTSAPSSPSATGAAGGVVSSSSDIKGPLPPTTFVTSAVKTVANAVSVPTSSSSAVTVIVTETAAATAGVSKDMEPNSLIQDKPLTSRLQTNTRALTTILLKNTPKNYTFIDIRWLEPGMRNIGPTTNRLLQDPEMVLALAADSVLDGFTH